MHVPNWLAKGDVCTKVDGRLADWINVGKIPASVHKGILISADEKQ